jgi:O-antigen/teichoic acid export membrane protein
MKLFLQSKFLKDILWNLNGYALPLIVALFSIPIIISNIGVEKFGIFTLIYALIGFMNVFDFGLARAITNFVVKYKNEGNYNKVLAVVKTGLLIMFLIALLLSILIQFFKYDIVTTVFSVSKSIFNETETSLSIIAFSLPFVIVQAGSVGVLEAFGKFKQISIAKIPFSIMMYAAPTIISFYFPTLIALSLSLCLLRIAMAVIFWMLQRKIIGQYVGSNIDEEESKITSGIVKELFKYGGWISVSNFIAPIMLYIDRFFVASIVGAGLVAYYTTPFEIVSKLSILAVSVSGVLFPLLAKNIKTDIIASNSFYLKAMIGIGCGLAIPVLAGIFFSKDILAIWIDDAFSQKAWPVFSLFLIGFFIHGLIQPAYIWIQAEGKPYITAAAHLFDFLLYIVYFPILTKQFGIQGAATAWILRVSISLIVLHSIRYILYRRILNEKISYCRGL